MIGCEKRRFAISNQMLSSGLVPLQRRVVLFQSDLSAFKSNGDKQSQPTAKPLTQNVRRINTCDVMGDGEELFLSESDGRKMSFDKWQAGNGVVFDDDC
jgi:hypothetical protein